MPNRLGLLIAAEHHEDVVAESELIAAVDEAFSMTGRGFTRWPDPQPDRSPLSEECSRLLDPRDVADPGRPSRGVSPRPSPRCASKAALPATTASSSRCSLRRHA